ncbi:MAG TPA: DUF554 domain-containing protein [Candidatus Scatovicinus merdipullorum]|nr:DUF554 domain-containing protein [Candidatus Scatovicinus merdipullorum]
MLGTIVNTAAVLLGGCIGLLLKKGLPQKLAEALMKALGLCTLYIGITGALEGENTLLLILSMVLGTVVGQLADLDRRINNLGSLIERKMARPGENKTIAQGFVSACLLFCVGAMTIVGSLQSGLTGDHSMLFTKSMLDFVAAVIFSSSFGIGVLFSAGFVLVYQGGITLLAQWVSPFLSTWVVNEMTCAGSVIIIGLALNMLGITKLKVMNYVPAIFFPILLCPLFQWLGNMLPAFAQ